MNNIQEKKKENNRELGLSKLGKGLTLVAIILWIVIFLAGLVINSEPYRNKMTLRAPNVFALIVNWTVVFFVFTPTNVAILSIFAGLIGALGRCATLHYITPGQDEEFPEDPINPYLSGVIRGFIVYLLVISGMIIISETPPISPTGPGQYVRIASVISVVSFIVSYNPKNFGKLLHQATESIIKKKKMTKD